MADYIGMCRSTWFKIKDYDKFMEGLEDVLMEDVGIDRDERDENKITIYGYSPIPHNIGNGEDYEEFEFLEYIQKHIAEGEKVRITEIGYEKLRYLTAVAYDITSNEIKIADASVY